MTTYIHIRLREAGPKVQLPLVTAVTYRNALRRKEVMSEWDKQVEQQITTWLNEEQAMPAEKIRGNSNSSRQ